MNDEIAMSWNIGLSNAPHARFTIQPVMLRRTEQVYSLSIALGASWGHCVSFTACKDPNIGRELTVENDEYRLVGDKY